MTKIYKTINIDLYKASIKIYYKFSLRELKKSLSETFVEADKEIIDTLLDNTLARAKCVVFPSGNSVIAVYKEKGASELEYMASLIHEICHSAFHLLNTRGFALDENSEEAYTYLIEYIYTELMKDV